MQQWYSAFYLALSVAYGYSQRTQVRGQKLPSGEWHYFVSVAS